MPVRIHTPALLAVALFVAAPALAQSSEQARPPAAMEFFAGHAAFVDDAAIGHTVFGVTARVYVTPRLGLGPELVYMRGPGSDRDLFFTGNLTFDLLSPRQRRPHLVSPFLVAGGGFFRNTNQFGGRDFSHVEGAFTAGGGLRFHVNDRVYAVADVRVGWELHTRITGGVGFALSR